MIFVGDIAIPNGVDIDIKGWPFNDNTPIISNLEGCVVEVNEDGKGVYNSDNSIQYLKRLNVVAVSLANNHIQDNSISFTDTITKLEKYGIQYFGATKKDSSEEYVKYIKIENEKIAIIAAGAYITAITKKRNISDECCIVNCIDEEKIIGIVEEIKMKNDDCRIICHFHWGCELELYPFPADRDFARKLIDKGVSAVIGCHSHCFQGVELYKNCPIVYGLGNFLFYQGYYWRGKLTFPEISTKELAFEIYSEGYRCHWFEYDRRNNILRYERTTSIDEAAKCYTPYNGLSSSEYAAWFKQNRRKRKLIPIFYSTDSKFAMYSKQKLLDFRELLITFLKSLKVKGGPH